MKWIAVRYAIFIIWLSYLVAACLMIFVQGFFLSRNALKDRAVCDKSGQCFDSDLKVVILLVDALRYDFVKSKQVEIEKPYSNKMVYLNDLLKENPLNSRLYKFIADPPTTTLQRIQALTTGTLPTFLDIGSNFGTSEITEDNIIDQLISKNKKIVFLGDDTWTQLYPDRFYRVSAFPSLNVWDLHTVDEGVETGFDYELNATDWNVLMGHVLGVDHVGHRHGPLHAAMTAKLKQIDRLIKNIVDRINNNHTVLFVFGDHGMTESGDHGGSSDQEVTSVLMVYSHNTNIIRYFDNVEIVNQIDIVPTLAQILGVPISFSSLGRTLLTEAPNAREYLRNNLRQIYTYVLKYSEQNLLFRNEINELAKNYKILEERYHNGDKDYANAVIKFIEIVQNLCRAHWVQFDYLCMISAIFLLFLTISFIFLISISTNFIIEKIIYDNILNFGYVSIIITELCIILLYLNRLISNFVIVSYFITVSLSKAFLLLIFFKYKLYFKIIIFIKSLSLLTICAGIILLLNCLAMFSNSFIVNEQYINVYLYTGLIWISLLSAHTTAYRKPWNSFIRTEYWKRICTAILFTCLVKFSTIYWVCREEHGPGCIVHKDGTFITPILSTCSLTMFLIFGRTLLQRYNYLDKSSSHISLNHTNVAIFCAICIGCSWIMKPFESWPMPKENNKIYSLIKSIFALSALIIGLVIFAITILWPESSSNLTRFKMPRKQCVSASFAYRKQCVSASFKLVSAIIIILSIISGDGRAVALICCIITTSIVAFNLNFYTGNGPSDSWVATIIWSLSSSYWFYGTGHQPAFPNIYWNVVELTSGYFGALLILTETFSSHVAHALLLPILCMFGNITRDSNIPSYQSMARWIISYILVQAIKIFACTVCCLVLCRHLMVWKIFAPKLIFEGIGFIFSIPIIIFGCIFFNNLRSIKLADNQLKP